ncbi:glucose-6-phosphate isomerase [Chloropicon roscoffensis]|uniref:Glucose-6-phosphate isomerase n=1 Tax=Chloropicon roscoffensis TaxID=1461544 RepID=A0A7S3FRE0_9CHLO
MLGRAPSSKLGPKVNIGGSVNNGSGPASPRKGAPVVDRQQANPPTQTTHLLQRQGVACASRKDLSLNALDMSEAVSSRDGAGHESIADTPAWQALVDHIPEIEETHLRYLLKDEERCLRLSLEHNGLYSDFSRQRVTPKTLELLFDLAKEAGLKEKIEQMFQGEQINETEHRSVLHVATRADRNQELIVDGKNVVKDVWTVLDKIKAFSDQVRNGEWLGATGKPIKDVVAIGIGGSFLGPLFVHTSLRTEPIAAMKAQGRQLRFLANVDPVDVARALHNLNQETTMVVIISKTFTTAETMLNARTVRKWITAELGESAVSKHMVAVSTNVKLVSQFGIDPDNTFEFWDWVGGRYSVCSAVGMLPLSLQYGFDQMEQFLEGARDIDQHFLNAPFEKNIPVTLGLVNLWNISFLHYPARAILPYCQALSKLAPHIQQVSMESNGKGVGMDGKPLKFEAGQIDFGEPGTNGQHSFYQLIHQGRVIPCDFIGTIKSQQSVYLKGEIVSNHDELMCNFFAQADALATGKNAVELRAENVPDNLIPHKTFTGNRPSTSILLPELNAYSTGQILALYEAMVAVKGFVWGINSFDQWGVELGKVLASKCRSKMNSARTQSRLIETSDGFNFSTTRLLNRYLKGKTFLQYPEPRDVFPCDLIDSENCIPPDDETIL